MLTELKFERTEYFSSAQRMSDFYVNNFRGRQIRSQGKDFIVIETEDEVITLKVAGLPSDPPDEAFSTPGDANNDFVNVTLGQIESHMRTAMKEGKSGINLSISLPGGETK